jgi:tetratricopeptide (TPR) repeat protein
LVTRIRSNPNKSTASSAEAKSCALENAQKLRPNSPETLLASGYYQYWVLRDYGLAKTTFKQVGKILPVSSSEVPYALGLVTRREGHWDESVAHWEEGLARDPRNAELLGYAAETYASLRQFPAALKLYDRALDVLPDDPDLMGVKASIYQAQGNLQEVAKLHRNTMFLRSARHMAIPGISTNDRERFVERGEEKLTAFLELERVTRESLRFQNAE